MKLHPSTVDETLNMVYAEFIEQARPYNESRLTVQSKPPTPELDKFGMVIPESLNKPDVWEARAGLAAALKACAEHFSSAQVAKFLTFLIHEPGALGDANDDVRHEMLAAGKAVIDFHGKANLSIMLPVLQNYLDTAATASERHDRIRESAVILLGAVAKHFESNDVRVEQVVDKLLATLSTPSEAVQVAVAECLPPLVKMLKDKSAAMIERLMAQTFSGASYAARRGGAYGLAGAIKGRGISALKECGVIDALKTAVEDKKSVEARQGAVFAFETLSSTLGRLFEPYILQILPYLLTAFGDSATVVRDATVDAARVIMANLSAHCVKLVLPAVLKGLEDYKWRTKAGSVELLGSMAYCAPKQLAISLPTIIPRLTAVLTDSHTQVQKAGKVALEQFTQVIQNPEIKDLVPVLLKALSDPSAHTQTALDALMKTSFAHYIDPPSLALVVPILERGLKERSSETKKRGAHIMGSMASLTQHKDLVPHLSTLMPLMREVLVDAVPEVRAVTARALGRMMDKLGEDNFPTLIAELLQTLKTDSTSVDRQGSAQGLAEILTSIGIERLEGLLPEITSMTQHPKPYVRDGFMALLVFLPLTFGDRFQPYLGMVVPCVLRGLADEFEYVRETSLKAGTIIVQRFAKKAIDLLLPALERGVFDENWRIRQSSVHLLGDLLFRIGGLTPNQVQIDEVVEEDEEGEGEGADEQGRRLIQQLLGIDRFNEVLASIYIVRSDLNSTVRQASLLVWKALVSNTPRTLKEILPQMMDKLIVCLGSDNFEQRQIAANTVSDLVQKLGDQVLGEIMPILYEKFKSVNEYTRLGVVAALEQILSSAVKNQVDHYADEMVGIVQMSISDTSSVVREAAAKAFDALQSHLGSRAIDEILPRLLANLQSDDADSDRQEFALEALQEIMAVRSHTVFPILIPSLIELPMTAQRARALASLVAVAGSTVNRHMKTILRALMSGIRQNDDAGPTIEQALKALLGAIEDDGVDLLLNHLSDLVEGDQDVSNNRHAACLMFAAFCEANDSADYDVIAPDWLPILIGFMDTALAGGAEVMQTAWRALDALVKRIPKDEMDELVPIAERSVRALVRDIAKRHGAEKKEIDALNLPKGAGPLVPIFLQGLMYGDPSIRELSAHGLGDMISHCKPEALKPFVVQVAGPLIRLVGEKLGWSVRSAMLTDLTLLLRQVPMNMKPFWPQLQRTFIKSLSDPQMEVRREASNGLGVLITHLTTVDAIVRELEKSLKESSEDDIKEAIMNALLQISDKAK